MFSLESLITFGGAFVAGAWNTGTQNPLRAGLQSAFVNLGTQGINTAMNDGYRVQPWQALTTGILSGFGTGTNFALERALMHGSGLGRPAAESSAFVLNSLYLFPAEILHADYWSQE